MDFTACPAPGKTADETVRDWAISYGGSITVNFATYKLLQQAGTSCDVLQQYVRLQG